MNNRNNMLTSLISIGATAAAIFGVVRGMRNKTFLPFLQTIMNSMSGSIAQQIPQAAQGMRNSQPPQNMTQPLQGMMNNQAAQQPASSSSPNNIKQSINNLSGNKSN